MNKILKYSVALIIVAIVSYFGFKHYYYGGNEKFFGKWVGKIDGEKITIIFRDEQKK